MESLEEHQARLHARRAATAKLTNQPEPDTTVKVYKPALSEDAESSTRQD